MNTVHRCGFEGCTRLTSAELCERHRRPAQSVSSAELIRRAREDRAEPDLLCRPQAEETRR